MAKQATTKTPSGILIEDSATYRVKLNRKVERHGAWLLPGREIKVSGKALRELGDAVDVAEPTQ